ncbi:xanthine dehydrogenase family protein molybdopterin-binding subunit [Parasedimentitalea maritima]|uniref:Xanthine dehydrogenase family protein molybdopterin-binding subunit n=1 Tax=Parasedimentitalea maritima TaxID=2578117 RepID=A0ABY2UU32_9RHOB|nr:xanthine dehydrogenase family protein molybdopterin-binding subunit [Zongyanglinia marina]TLP59399.1 xanthine dehydrogenase family protein molybdopterin-binding subunit [Zongyanglinia marina]
MQDQNSHIGQRVIRREDAVLVAGQGAYTDDILLQNPLHVSFLRSVEARGDIAELETEDALAAEGVVAVHTGADVAHLGRLTVNPLIPLSVQTEFPVLAQGQVHAVGQPVAAILATSNALALDAVELVYAEIDDALATGPDVAPDLVAEQAWSAGDAAAGLAAADHIVETAILHPRLAPSPMEPRAIAVAYHQDRDAVTVWHSTQTPHRSRSALAVILGIDADRIRVIAPHVGGAFGMKASLYPEDVIAVWAAFHHKRDVKWTATRSEEFLSATHGRGLTTIGRLAVNKDGMFQALQAEVNGPVGHWLPNSALTTVWNAARILPAGYQIENLEISTRAQAHNLAPTGIYRGAGRPEANCLIERLVDKAAVVTGLDPVEIRRRNLLDASAFPHRTGTGNVLDSGDYSRVLDVLMDKGGYNEALKERDVRRASGELVGLGIGFYLEPSGTGWETARVTLNADGGVLVASGSSTQGHGRETAFAQIAADTLQIPMKQITVICGDTKNCPEGIGALASRSTAIGGSAVLRACEEIRTRLDQGETAPLVADLRYENEGEAWGNGAYMILLSVDGDTGVPSIERAVAVDDTGRIINPMQVAGQVLGGFAQGLGEALMEQVIYDEDGQLLTGSFMDYALPRAGDMPLLSQHTFQTPSPMNALGAKGVGEAGTIGAPAAILNAAIDALCPLGVEDLQMPLTSQTLWRAIQAAEEGAAT